MKAWHALCHMFPDNTWNHDAMGALPALMEFADEQGAATLLFPNARASDRISITPDTVQQILAFAAEKEQTLIDLRSRVAELEHMLQTDELTGLLNRRGLETAGKRELANAARHRETGLLAVIDLDGFKLVNDKHGHAAGDAALRRVGHILKEHIRATDYAARLAGDEFAVLWVRALPLALDQRLRNLKRALNAAVLDWNGTPIAIKASAGTAGYDAASQFDDLMARADKAMYRQKRVRRRS
ncbi:MAG: GGDEF domain-containing protein [Micropepsaceae bacterium]